MDSITDGHWGDGFYEKELEDLLSKQWVSVKDELPDKPTKFCRILGRNSIGQVGVVSWLNADEPDCCGYQMWTEWFDHDFTHEKFANYITHWMYIP